ncbi:four helix bundle protein [Candidatus Kaiserbacteria bacterium RIFCSPHIGHO2_02_FULL_55_25]|uniref:Four helix bundle protein n=1 Tax=Candidatus Kaiserbacteria bacterium RIFCSPHIGHO2_02_FULL_55_25 TaxID=1798498 RepID=A0A1F6E7M2_9BACT|nr:MAG: four helix bundle protein [Candidatus Kaiserbacteria bacterium RIFCSPHIGHO2_01_FULL_55_79]OGG69611.1 MAG: four helix bundle protein [Candidatus Kaiserbacteria bacterium RIFCSPHIGHO2_02_FULL_55_25]OGG76968.1 MAG: four helix bundle protein [Candidatus Kaiserbacteria bacterium RIFCSPHIGHO2_12_FULL_55_13]OGG83270.1 MAG: four helix bundle protein [Candidatus Kaiserbacteria bacterium RIFCSPLOWO2_01_FULL_55_25]
MNPEIESHKDLLVWQKAVTLSMAVYAMTEKFPAREMYSLSSQMRRAVVSIPSNIAEGKARRTRADYVHFLHMAYGSASELETQLLIAARLGFCSEKVYEETNSLLAEVSKMLRAIINKLATAR